MVNHLEKPIKKVFQHIAELCLFVSITIPLATVFIINNSLANGVVSGKYFWFYGSMGLVSLVTLMYYLINKPSFRFSLADGFLCCFVGSIFLSSCIFNEASANFTKLFLLALLFVLYICLRWVLDSGSKKIQALLCIFIILTGLVEAVWGFQQLYGFKHSQHGLFKLTGSFFNPGPYAGYLSVVFPMALYELRMMSEKLRAKRADRKVGYLMLTSLPTLIFYLLSIGSVIAILCVLPATMSRAAWLAAIAGSVVVIIGCFRSSHFTFRSSRLLKILTVILLVFTAIVAVSGMYYLKKNSADGRLLTWKVSLSALVKHPLGVGLGHFPSAYGDAQAAYFASGNASETEAYVAGNPEYGFNEYLQIAIESGIVALLLFIGVIVCVFRSLIRAKSWGMLGSLAALLVFACFSYPFSILPFSIILVFLLAMSINRTQMTQTVQMNPENKIRSVSLSLICMQICCVIVTAFCIWRQYPVYVACKQWNIDRLYYKNGMYSEAAKKYEPLYPYLNDQIQFLFEYGSSLSRSATDHSKWIEKETRHFRWPPQLADRIDRLKLSNEVLKHAMKISCDPMLYNIMGQNHQEMKEYDLAERSLLKSALIVPNRLYPYYLLMKLYLEKGDEAKAHEMADIVLTKEPKVHSRAVEEMREEAEELKTKS